MTPASRVERRRAHLLHRIHRKFATVTENVTAGGMTFPFTRIADPNRVLDQVAEEEDRRDRLAGKRRDGEELHLPYWAELWDSAYGVGEVLAEMLQIRTPQSPIPNQNLLDLGCGMGLAGAVAARLGARVVFADLEAEALLFARLNSIEFSDRVRTHRLDWRRGRIEDRFDLIVGADILYDKTQWQHLEPFWRGHLKPGGTVLLGEPGRQTGEMFLEWIKPWKWRVEEIKKTVPTRATPIRILRLARAD